MTVTHALAGTDPKVSLNFPDGSSLVRARELPWTPWGSPGTHFKLLHCDDQASMLVLLLKVDPGTVLGIHKHFGSAHAFNVEGGFGYEHGEAFEGDYIHEGGGITHQPFTGRTGVVMFAVVFGPIGGVDEQGNVVGLLDIEWHYNAAKANGAADHIQRRVSASR